jgi:hypothetical protein
MSSDHLRELLESLRHELDRTDAVDERSRALLREVDAEIREALDRPEPHAESVSERLRDTIQNFEGEHPRLTEAVSRVIDALVKMGI